MDPATNRAIVWRMGVFIFGLFVFGAAVLAALADVGSNIPEFILLVGVFVTAYGAGRIGISKRHHDERPHPRDHQ